MSTYVLVVNSGSSSLKFAIIEAMSGNAIISGIAESIGSKNCSLHYKYQGVKFLCTIPEFADHEKAMECIELELKKYLFLQEKLIAVGHRVVHGGEDFTSSVLINNRVKETIRKNAKIAPLHNPANLMGIESAQKTYPNLPHIAVFDTAFFQTMPKRSYLYALPYSLYKEHGIRRYGFHGSSHYFVNKRASKLLGKKYEHCNLISAHLGNGCSIAAIKQGKAVDTSLGFTPLEGLVMGTRSGDIDPSIPLYLKDTLGYSDDDVNRLLNKKSGLLGISQNSNDFRTLQENSEQGDELSSLAIEIFCYRLAKYIASYLVATGPLDALVFTGGIGENSNLVREKTLKHLEHLGFDFDREKNNSSTSSEFSIRRNSICEIFVIPTNEEWVIAQDAIKISQVSEVEELCHAV